MCLAIALTLLLRGLYLARFGWDPWWANAVYFAQAKSLAVGPTAIFGPPLALWALRGMRGIGLSAVGALECLYLIAQLAFSAGVIGLGRALYPSHSPRRERLLAILVATLPVAAGFEGYMDIGALVGAACTVWTVALAAARPPLNGRRAAALFTVALVGGATRTESLVTTLMVALLLAGWGARMAGPRARGTAGLLTLAGAAAIATTLWAHRSYVGRWELSAPTYPFYTFSAGLSPWQCPGRCEGEFAPYLESVRQFGSYLENRGSVLHAWLQHPWALLVRSGWKVLEWAVRLVDPQRFGPVHLGLAAIGLRAWERCQPSHAWLLAGFAGAALVLLVPPASPMYMMVALPPLLLAAGLGADSIFQGLSRRSQRGVLAIWSVLAVGWAGWLGGRGPSTSPVVHHAAAFLEQRCAGGCMTNYVPAHVSAEAWVNLQAAEPLPPHDNTQEDFVYGKLPADFRERCNFRSRVKKARQAGYSGPILFVEARVASAFSPVGFDREHDYEGPVDLSHALLEATFSAGTDMLRIWSFPPTAAP